MTEIVTTEDAPESTPTLVVEKPLEPTPKVFDEAYVKSLRDEAAAARHAKKDAVDAAVAALTATHAAELADRDVAYTALQTELGNAWIELEKVYTTIDAKVPSDRVRAFASFLQGEDKESITESAKAAYELAGGFDGKSPAFDPSMGKGGKPPLALNGDGIINAMLSIINK